MTSIQRSPRQNQLNSLPARLDYPKRNRPVFAKRLSQYEFFTDSLNDPEVPSPSPPRKEEKKSALVGRPRRANGGATTLSAAFRATAGIADENRPPSSTSSSEQKRTQFVPKIRPSQARERDSPGPAERQASEDGAGAGRGRTTKKLRAASSTPSPPRGLREAYNRIVDEENLAAQEHDSDDHDEGFEVQNQGRHDIESPTALTRSRRSPPFAEKGEPYDDPMGANGLEDVKRIHGSGSESPASELSFMENMTDDTFGKVIADHARDQQRMNGALKNNRQIFRKAQVGRRASLTLENLHRRDELNEVRRYSQPEMTGGGSIGSDRSDPPVHVPRTWGRKGRGGKEWLNRINNPGGRLTGDEPPTLSQVGEAHPNAQDGQNDAKIDWLSAAADIPLPSVEAGSSQRGRSPRTSTPSSTVKRSTSSDRIREWEVDNDFTARSIQISTSPVLKIRSGTLDSIRDREIESLKGIAVTTNRLGEIRERSVEQLSRRVSTAGSDVNKDVESTAQIAAAETVKAPKSSPTKQQSNDYSDSNLSKYFENTEGDPIPDTPIVVFKNTDKRSQRRESGLGSNTVNGSMPQRPTHHRHDSRDLLRKLARVTSASPSSVDKSELKSEPQIRENIQTAFQPLDPRQDPKKPGYDVESEIIKSRPSVIEADEAKPNAHHSATGPSKSPAKKENREELGRNTEAILAASGIGVVVRDKPKTEREANGTPKSSQSVPPLKTPIVTGAWVNTPAPTAQQHPASPPLDLDVDKEISALGMRNFIRGPSSSPLYQRGGGIEDRPAKDEGPPRPKSALAAILEKPKLEAKAGDGPNNHDDKAKDEEELGESTIDSLEDMIANDTDFSSLLDFGNEESGNGTIHGSDGQTLSVSERERKLEMLAYERMNQRLKTLRLSIREAKRGIEGLEHKVEHAPTEAWPCPSCGCPSGGRRLANRRQSRLRRYIPSLYKWPDGGYLNPTWMGWLLLLIGAWCISEYTLCEIYCQPRYAYRMEGYGVNIYAPRMPWVTATMIWRPLSWFVLPVWKVLCWMAWQVYGHDAQQARAGGRVSTHESGSRGGQTDGTTDNIVLVWENGVQILRKISTKTDSRYSREDRYAKEVPVAEDMRIPRPSWAPDLSMMDDEYL